MWPDRHWPRGDALHKNSVSSVRNSGFLVRLPSRALGSVCRSLPGREPGMGQETWSAADWVPYGYRPSLSQMRWALSAACEFQKRSDVMIVRRA